ncbi:MAG: RcnB family protein [Caulobacterales bacterium]
MKRTFKRTVIGAAAALMLVAPIAAMPSYASAAPAIQQNVQHDRWDRNGRNDRDDRRGENYGRNDRDDRRGDNYRNNDRHNDRGWNNARYDRYDRYDRRDHREWRRGDRLPVSYRSHYREVSYRDHGWRAPPRGYHYVRDDRGETLLVGIATGAILGVILSGN